MVSVKSQLIALTAEISFYTIYEANTDGRIVLWIHMNMAYFWGIDGRSRLVMTFFPPPQRDSGKKVRRQMF